MDFYIGTLMPFPYNFTPQDWLPCNGQLLQIQQYTALFSLLGNAYGGNGSTTFALPQLNTGQTPMPVRAAMGQGNGPGLTPRSMGQAVGSDTATLDVAQMPAHTHSFGLPAVPAGTTPSAVPVTNGALVNQTAGTFVKPGLTPVMLHPTTISITGGFQSHDNVQPWIALYWCICVDGIFPPRP